MEVSYRTEAEPGGPGNGATAAFEAEMLPHLDAAFALARSILRDDHDAQDAVQEAYLRAYRHFAGFRGGDARGWLLAIVRNAALTQRRRVGRERAVEPLEQAEHVPGPADDPETAHLRAVGRERVRAAIDRLAPEFREVILLRELGGLSYQEIADEIGVPPGTVMSRLARARQQLRRLLHEAWAGGGGA